MPNSWACLALRFQDFAGIIIDPLGYETFRLDASHCDIYEPVTGRFHEGVEALDLAVNAFTAAIIVANWAFISARSSASTPHGSGR